MLFYTSQVLSFGRGLLLNSKKKKGKKSETAELQEKKLTYRVGFKATWHHIKRIRRESAANWCQRETIYYNFWHQCVGGEMDCTWL